MKRGLIKNRDEGRIVTGTRDTAGQESSTVLSCMPCPVLSCNVLQSLSYLVV